MTEFSGFLKNLAPGLKDHEIEIVFNKFDVNGDKKINFSEFKQKLDYGLLHNRENLYNAEKVYKLAKNLKKILISWEIDIDILFKKYDDSNE